MAHKKDYKPEDIMFPEQRIVQSELVHEMKARTSTTRCPSLSAVRCPMYATV